jgi:SAM-dependent methyltransferase
MVKARVYDFMYRVWVPWDSIGVRADLVNLLARGDITPERYPRSIDLGCGTGANVVYLAEQGFDSWGVDFSTVAIRKARRRAAKSAATPTFVVGDLTAGHIAGVDGPFDLLIDFGTLDDLKGPARKQMAGTITGLSRPGSKFLEYCFYGNREDVPWFSMNASKLTPRIAPGELESLFGDGWDIEPFASYPKWGTEVFLLTRR